MEIDYELIGKRIREERISQNLSQQTLAEISNISPTNISHIERGATKLSLPTLVSICLLYTSHPYKSMHKKIK